MRGTGSPPCSTPSSRNGAATSKPGADIASIGEGWVGFAIFMCLYSEESWPTLNKGLAQAFTGRGDILLAKGDVGRRAQRLGRVRRRVPTCRRMIPVRCADWPASSPDDARGAVSPSPKAEHPLWARMNGLLYDNCGTWPGEVRKP